MAAYLASASSISVVGRSVVVVVVLGDDIVFVLLMYISWGASCVRKSVRVGVEEEGGGRGRVMRDEIFSFSSPDAERLQSFFCVFCVLS